MLRLRGVPRLCTVPSRAPSPLQWPRRSFSSSSSRRSHHPGYFRFLDDIPQNTVFWGIIGLNVGVFTMSWWARKNCRTQPIHVYLDAKTFQNYWKNLSAGRIWTLFTSTFTHSDTDISHILFNGFTFYFLAPLTLSILGSRQFIFLYLGGGAVAELGSIAYKNVFQQGRDPYACGASAAIYSVLSFLAFQSPGATLLLYAIVPVPIWLAVSGLFTYDIYRTAADKGGTTNTSAHVGGILAGAGYFFLRRFRIF